MKDKKHKLEYGVDESYALDIPANSKDAILRSKTVWGALRGLETFSQLIQSRPMRDEDGKIVYYEDDEDFDQSDYGFENLYIPEVPIRIRDSPKYSHRGLMLGNINKQEWKMTIKFSSHDEAKSDPWTLQIPQETIILFKIF